MRIALLVVTAAFIAQATPPRDASATRAGAGAIIRGRVISAATNQPLHRVRVTLNAQLPNPPSAVTDTRGDYEISGFKASSTDTWESDDGTTTHAYALTYFPGVSGMDQAERVTLGIGQDLRNFNFAMRPSSSSSRRRLARSTVPSRRRQAGARVISRSSRSRKTQRPGRPPCGTSRRRVRTTKAGSRFAACPPATTSSSRVTSSKRVSGLCRAGLQPRGSNPQQGDRVGARGFQGRREARGCTRGKNVDAAADHR